MTTPLPVLNAEIAIIGVISEWIREWKVSVFHGLISCYPNEYMLV